MSDERPHGRYELLVSTVYGCSGVVLGVISMVRPKMLNWVIKGKIQEEGENENDRKDDALSRVIGAHITAASVAYLKSQSGSLTPSEASLLTAAATASPLFFFTLRQKDILCLTSIHIPVVATAAYRILEELAA